jgi:hypothetical protein
MMANVFNRVPEQLGKRADTLLFDDAKYRVDLAMVHELNTSLSRGVSIYRDPSEDVYLQVNELVALELLPVFEALWIRLRHELPSLAAHFAVRTARRRSSR